VRPAGPVPVSPRRRALLPACAALLALALAGALAVLPGRPAPDAGPPENDRPALRVTTAPVEGRTVQRGVDTVGSLLAWDEVVARSQISGTVARLHADLGDRVRAGQPLAELDRREADLAVEQLQADLRGAREGLARARAAAAAARANLERVQASRSALLAELERARVDAEWKQSELRRSEDLHARELIATRDVDQARAQWRAAGALVSVAETTLAQHADQVRAAEAQLAADEGAVKAAQAQLEQRAAALELGRKRLGDTVVLAPISGLVARRHVAAGEFVKDNTPLLTVVAVDPVKYAGTVAERAAPELRGGQELRIEVEAHGGRRFAGQVTRIAPVVDVATRTLALEARVPNGQGLLKPGFFARGVVLTRRERGIPFVPADAVAYVVGVTKVFVIAEGRARERLVKAGLREGGRVEILDGVRPGEVVATSGLAQLYDGAPVATAPAPDGRPPAAGAPAPGR
jgi:membrane fusion protein (multidrug efflux system)